MSGFQFPNHGNSSHSFGQTNKKNIGYCCWVFRAPVIAPPPPPYQVHLKSFNQEKLRKREILISVDLITTPGIQDSSKKKKKAITSSWWSKINQYLSVKHFIFGLLQVQRIFDSNNVLLKRYLCFGLWHNLPWPKGQFYPVGVILDFKLGKVYMFTLSHQAEFHWLE